MINIIGGKLKNTKILVPELNVRPTSIIKRKSIFSTLESYALKNSYELYKEKSFIDLYAGSGSLGLEALSRGAKFCYFVEKNSHVINFLNKNCLKVVKKDHYQIISEDINFLDFSDFKTPISTIFIDPPYRTNPFKIILNKIKKNVFIDKNTKIVIETDVKTKLDLPKEYMILKEKKFKNTLITFIKLI